MAFARGYAANSDILAANDNVNGNWTFSYDDFNRLSGANQNGGAAVYSYAYDRFGNRWQQNGPYSMLLSFSSANNRMDGYSYDAAGNLSNDGSHQYFYDAESRLIQVDGTFGNCATATACYVYDADGQRVQKSSSAGTVSYVYDLAGHQVAEFNSGGGWNRGEVYAGGRHLATYANGTTYFIHSDWLGTERARSDVAGATYETCQSLPFGDWLICSGGDPSPMHFTGKQRDSEDNVDYFGARYYSSARGRFMSPDWSNPPMPVPYADLRDPQSLNLFSYEGNNPVNQADSDGHCCEQVQQLERIAVSLGQQMKHAGAATIRDYVKALNASGKALTGNSDFNVSHITESDIHNLGVQAALILATEGANEEFNLARAAESFFGSKSFAEAGSVFGGEFENGGSALVNFAKTGDSLTVGVEMAASPEGVTGTLSAIQKGAISAAEDAGASSVTIVAKDVTNEQLASVLEKKGFTQEFKDGKATGNWSKTIKINPI